MIFININNKHLLPLAFSLVSILIIVNALMSTVWLFILPTGLICFAVFSFCTYTHTHNAWYIYALVALTLIIIAYLLMSDSGIQLSNLEANFATLFIICVFFFPSVVYYFTQVSYRAPLLLMLMLMPLLLIKLQFLDLPPLLVALQITLFFMMMAAYHTPIRLSRAFRQSLFYFFVPVFMLSFLIILYVNINAPAASYQFSGISTDLLERNAHSSEGGPGSDRILFLVEAEEPLYLMRQTYGKYDGEYWLYFDRPPYSNGFYNWESRAQHGNFENLFKAMRDFSKADAEFATLFAQDLPPFDEIRKKATIIPQNIPTSYLLAPMRTFRFTGMPEGIIPLRSAADEFFIADSGRMDGNTAYAVYYFSDEFRRDLTIQRWAADFDENRTMYLGNYLSEKRPMRLKDFIANFKEEWINAYNFPAFVGEYISPELDQLAAQIVKGITNDYEKAATLENYLSGFTYDLNYKPPEGRNDIEYFLLESQKGGCVQFATAMTLMARSVGLIARYAEGFIATEVNDIGQYVVRARHAHAFSQVFIAPYGWVTFEATPVSYIESLNAPSDKKKFALSGVMLIFFALTVLSVLGLFMLLLYKIVIKEALFRRRVLKSDATQAVLILFRKMSVLVSQPQRLGGLTAQEVVNLANQRYQVNLTYAAECYERAAYNGEWMQDNEKKAVFSVYVQFYESMRT